MGHRNEGGVTSRVSPTHLSPVWRRRFRKSSQGETFPRERSEKERERPVVCSVSRGDGNGRGQEGGGMVRTLCW